MQILRVALVASTIALGLSSCSEESVVTPTPAPSSKTVSNLNPTEADGWAYYSFDKDTTVEASKANGSDWDIKFRYIPFDQTGAAVVKVYTQTGPIFLNSGTVNVNGQTQGCLVNNRTFESIDSVESSFVFRNDDTLGTERLFPKVALGPSQTPQYFVYNTTSNTVGVNANITYVIKTKSNKYVKFRLLSVYKDAPQTPTVMSPLNYYTFAYVKSDSKSFK